MTRFHGLADIAHSVLHQVRPADLTVMRRALFLSAFAFVVTLLMGPRLINRLRRMGIGKKINIDAPATHMVKVGTPTMGGIMIWMSVFIVNAIFNLLNSLSMLLPLGVVLACGTLGAVDDLLNLQGGKRTGITARFKFSWLTVFAVAAAMALHLPSPFGLDLESMYIPFYGKIDIGDWYLPIAVLVIVAMSNAVNLTDGLDTLAGGPLALAFTAYGVVAYLQDQKFVSILCFTVVGALLAFLWFNAHPAQVFMGDTGSLSLGALLAVVAFMTGQWLLLPVIGIVFVMTASSVVLQISYFKLTRGKRIWKASPMHHHLEMSGWKETQISLRYWIIAMVAAMIGVGLALS